MISFRVGFEINSVAAVSAFPHIYAQNTTITGYVVNFHSEFVFRNMITYLFCPYNKSDSLRKGILCTFHRRRVLYSTMRGAASIPTSVMVFLFVSLPQHRQKFQSLYWRFTCKLTVADTEIKLLIKFETMILTVLFSLKSSQCLREVATFSILDNLLYYASR